MCVCVSVALLPSTPPFEWCNKSDPVSGGFAKDDDDDEMKVREKAFSYLAKLCYLAQQ